MLEFTPLKSKMSCVRTRVLPSGSGMDENIASRGIL